MGLEKELIEIDKSISNKEDELKKVQKELWDLKCKKYDIEFEINKDKCIEEVHKFVGIHGNVLNKKLHNELRVKLVELLYKDENCVSSYDLVLRKIFEKIEINHRYLDEKDGNTKWNLLEIQL
jgi:hypothetical protein